MIPLFFLITLPPPTSTLFPYTTLFRSVPPRRRSRRHPRERHPRTRPAHVHERSRLIIHLGQQARREESRRDRSEEHTSELQSRVDLVCRLLLEKKKKKKKNYRIQQKKT